MKEYLIIGLGIIAILFVIWLVLKLCNKFAPESSTFDACLSFLDGLELGDLSKAPYYFTKEKVASMMQADLKRLSAKE
jgi:hypothetical protein